jgi:hypothetical protein
MTAVLGAASIGSQCVGCVEQFARLRFRKRRRASLVAVSSGAQHPMRVRCVKLRIHSVLRIAEFLGPDNDEGQSKVRVEQHGRFVMELEL